jgi:hypothetical protein
VPVSLSHEIVSPEVVSKISFCSFLIIFLKICTVMTKLYSIQRDIQFFLLVHRHTYFLICSPLANYKYVMWASFCNQTFVVSSTTQQKHPSPHPLTTSTYKHMREVLFWHFFSIPFGLHLDVTDRIFNVWQYHDQVTGTWQFICKLHRIDNYKWITTGKHNVLLCKI